MGKGLFSILMGVALALAGTSAAGAAAVCTKSDLVAVNKVNDLLAHLVENTKVDCAPAPDTKQCSFVCVSKYSMTGDQRRAVLVWLTGAVGKEANARHVSHFGTLYYVDRDIGAQGWGWSMPIAKAAEIQHLAFVGQIGGKETIARTVAAFKKYRPQKH